MNCPDSPATRRLLSSLSFGSYLVYSSHGITEVSESSKAIVGKIKRGDQNLIARILQRLIADDPPELRGLFGDDVVLVPTPGSSPLYRGAVSTSQIICQAMLAAGLAATVGAYLERRVAVPKSAFAKAEDRPSAVRHYETMAANAQLIKPARLLLVDDVVTKGCTLLAAASRLSEAFPDVPIKAFGLVRTISPGEVEKIVEPCEGQITRYGDKARRRP